MKMRIHTDEFYLQIQKGIAEHGRMILSVEGDKKHPPFYYTIGNHLNGVPEFILIGAFKPEWAQAIINAISDGAINEGVTYPNGKEVYLSPTGHPLKVWDTSLIAKLNYTLQATEYFGHKDYDVQQIVVPDPKGRYPGDKKCTRKYRVPLLRATAEIMESLTVH